MHCEANAAPRPRATTSISVLVTPNRLMPTHDDLAAMVNEETVCYSAIAARFDKL